MMKTQLTLDGVIQMTMRIGENWAVAHAIRLFKLIKQIGADMPFDSHVLALAAYLHDRGAPLSSVEYIQISKGE